MARLPENIEKTICISLLACYPVNRMLVIIHSASLSD